MEELRFRFLGQSGIVLYVSGSQGVIDPYLSNSVAERFGSTFQRQVPPPITPEELGRVGWVCLTHAHEDHTDPSTLVRLAAATSEPIFYAPREAVEVMVTSGIALNRIRIAPENWISVASDTQMRAVPAAHPMLERDDESQLRYCGYLFRIGDLLLYHAGDTMPHPDIVASVAREGYPDVAFLPCNERNVYRDRAGIVGNMSVREMLTFASELHAKSIVAIHWDMFRPNSVLPSEILLVAADEAANTPILIPQCGCQYDMGFNRIDESKVPSPGERPRFFGTGKG